MTFKELFEKAVGQVDPEGKYCGRHDTIYEVKNQLEELLRPLVAESKWERFYVSIPYMRGEETTLSFYYLDAKAEIPFKVKLKKNGTRHSYYGDSTYYLPVVAFTCDESLMNQDIVKYLDFLFNTSVEVKTAIAEDQKKKAILEEHAEILEAYRNAVAKFNELSLDVRTQLRYSNLPSLCFW